MIEIYTFSKSDMNRLLTGILLCTDELPLSKYEKKRYIKLAKYLNDRIEFTKKLEEWRRKDGI